MKGSTPVMRILYGVVLTAGALLVACTEAPTAAGDPEAPLLGRSNDNGATFTQFRATDMAIPPFYFARGVVEQRDGHLVMRGVGITNRISAIDDELDYLTCDSHSTINANLLLADGTGLMWGKVECVPSGGGVWQGSWTGKREMTAPLTWLTTMKIVLQGRGGDIDGLQVRAEELNTYVCGPPCTDPFGLSPLGFISGTILDPH